MNLDDVLKQVQILFWVVSLFFVFCGLCITIRGWRVSSQNARNLAIQKDIHESIDNVVRSLAELEDAALSYWLDNESKTRAYQLINFHRRTLNHLKQLLELKGGILPSSEIINLRKACTLDAESANRPISEGDDRVRRISLIISRITNSQLLQKSWKD